MLEVVLAAAPVQSQTLYEDGFYRIDGESVVFRLFTRNGQRLSCGVASGEHLRNLGGEGRIAVLPRVAKELGSGRTWAGTCEVVDGFYRVNSVGTVWWLYSKGADPSRKLLACGVSSGEHLARLGGTTQVQNLPRGTDAGAQRNWTGTCPDWV